MPTPAQIPPHITTAIIGHVEGNSWFELDDRDDDDRIGFATRENGDVGGETPGEIDMAEAQRLCRAIPERFPGATCSTETCDEWTHLTVTFTAADNHPTH